MNPFAMRTGLSLILARIGFIEVLAVILGIPVFGLLGLMPIAYSGTLLLMGPNQAATLPEKSVKRYYRGVLLTSR
jgi:hypothetical protein